MREKFNFDDWMEYDEENFESKLREDAPAEIKKEYENYLKERITGEKVVR